MKTKNHIVKKIMSFILVLLILAGVGVYMTPLETLIDVVAWHLNAQSNKGVKCDVGMQVGLKKKFPQLEQVHQLVGLKQAPVASKYWYLLQQNGFIYRIQGLSQNLNIFLDISKATNSGGEKGLLGFAFHPDYKRNGFVFVYYTTGDLISRVSRFQLKKNQNDSLDKKSEKVILEVKQPESNHNGGDITFGPGGFLYISLGDGGGAGDSHNKIGNAQDTNTLLGSILRIDVNTALPYKTPRTNPFVKRAGRNEIYAFGLRNAWRMSFDQKTNVLWAADVGQDDWEEINIIKKGRNYGWRIQEGTHCFNPEKNCKIRRLTQPIYEYSHKDGRSITGGYVYRGKIRKLNGAYLFTDFFKGPLWALSKSPSGIYTRRVLANLDFYTSSFAQGNDGEVYILNYAGGAGESVYKIVTSKDCK